MPLNSAISEEFVLNASYRGMPPGERRLVASEIGSKGWSPFGGVMSLPLLSIDLGVFKQNTETMLHITKSSNAEIAPHAKTPMSPRLTQAMIDAGAWGASVADIRQAAVMLDAGQNRILIANEIGGVNAARRLAALLETHENAEIYIFVDSPELLIALDSAWLTNQKLPPLNLLLEVGCGRGGVVSHEAFLSLLSAATTLSDSRLKIAGVACYEGTANRPDKDEMLRTMRDLFDRTELGLAAVRSHVGADIPLILSAGGSSFFDYVIRDLGPLKARDTNLTLLLRSGACFFSDSGPIRQRLKAVVERGLLGKDLLQRIEASFHPSLRLWAEVLSRNIEDTAICGIGLRDASYDQGLPVPLRLWRDGKTVQSLEEKAELIKLNDQHGFVKFEKLDIRVGDVIEFGIQHPCTCFDKHNVIYVLGDHGKVVDVYKTYFG